MSRVKTGLNNLQTVNSSVSREWHSMLNGSIQETAIRIPLNCFPETTKKSGGNVPGVAMNGNQV